MMRTRHLITPLFFGMFALCSCAKKAPVTQSKVSKPIQGIVNRDQQIEVNLTERGDHVRLDLLFETENEHQKWTTTTNITREKYTRGWRVAPYYLAGGAIYVGAGYNDAKYNQKDRTTYMILGIGLTLMGAAQASSGLLPGQELGEENYRNVLEYWSEKVPTPWIQVRIEDDKGVVLAEGRTGEDGSFAAAVTEPVPSVVIHIAKTSKTVSLSHTELWMSHLKNGFMERYSTDLVDAFTWLQTTETPPAVWEMACAQATTRFRKLLRSDKAGEVVGIINKSTESCRSIEMTYIKAVSPRLRSLANQGDVEGLKQALSPLGEDARKHTGSPLEQCARIVQDFNEGDGSEPLAHEVINRLETLGRLPDGSRCAQSVRSKSLRIIEQAEATRRKQQATCQKARTQIRKAMRPLVTMQYADIALNGLHGLKTPLVTKMQNMVYRGGPTYEEQDFVDCATNALAASDDLIRGIYQMNQGGYAHEWLAEERFGLGQEGILSRIAEPDALCRSYVRRNFGSAMLGPIDTYLSWANSINKDCEP